MWSVKSQYTANRFIIIQRQVSDPNDHSMISIEIYNFLDSFY